MTCTIRITLSLRGLPLLTVLRNTVNDWYTKTSLHHYANYSINMANSGVKNFVDAKVQGSKVMVFSKSYCPYCKMAKDVLKKYPITVDVVEIENRNDCDEIQDYLRVLTGGRSVPRVFIDGKYIGGGSETTALDRKGTLKIMLEEAGAM